MDMDDLINRRRRDYRLVFESEPGRRVLLALMRQHFIFQTTKVPGDAGESAYREGRRSVVLDIIRVLRIEEDELLNLPQETEGYE